MPYEEVPAFVQRLRKRESFSRLALEFAIFMAARSGEVRGATWGEFDLEKGLWKLSKDRMKAYREHVVPLTRRDRKSGVEGTSGSVRIALGGRRSIKKKKT